MSKSYSETTGIIQGVIAYMQDDANKAALAAKDFDVTKPLGGGAEHRPTQHRAGTTQSPVGQEDHRTQHGTRHRVHRRERDD
jgi:hypothetical protein